MAKVSMENLGVAALGKERRKKGEPKAKKPPVDRSLRGQFRMLMAGLDIEKLKKPWMATKSFVNLTTEAELVAYVDSILNDESLWQQPYYNKPDRMPVLAVDTETYGLDTRVIIDFEWVKDSSGRDICIPIHEINLEIAGICLSADGIKGVYIPLTHEDGRNIPFEIAQRELQRLFDRSHLLFYNAKFDREVLRQTLGIVFRDYPFFEDIQALYFSNDPKADLDDDTFTGRGEGLKGLSHDLLGIEQIELDQIGKVKAYPELPPKEQEAIRLRPQWIRTIKKDKAICVTCGEPAKLWRVQIVKHDDGTEELTRSAECERCTTKVEYKKQTARVQYVPFQWIPIDVAVWYAAPDAVCTWLVWNHQPERLNPEDPEPDNFHVEAQKRHNIHRIDGELCDTLTWIERQRFEIDVERHERLVKWANAANEARRQKLREIAKRDGWVEDADDEGNVFPETIFNPDSKLHMPKLLFDIKGFIPTKITKDGHRSCDKTVLADLLKEHPHDEFLRALAEYRQYVALHPENLAYDKRDKTARIYLKQSVVAGGRLAASGGEFERDGGLSLNIQAVKKVGGNWWLTGDLLEPDTVLDADVEQREEDDLHPSCFQPVKKDEVVSASGQILEPDDPIYAESAAKMGFIHRKGKWVRKAPNILKNHIGHYLGYAMCLVPGCTTCAEKHGVLLKKTKLDANQVINLRALFKAPSGWTMVCTDYSNIEVRGAANISGEPELQKIFLEGDGDHHSLTASKVFPEFNDPNTSKARRKELRAIAKIINFALQYGGSEHTIYQNLKKTIPDITYERAKEMVDDYWKGVPKYHKWSKEKRRIARELMFCETDLGRIVKFQSAMDALRITKPTTEQIKRKFDYYRIRKQFRAMEARFKESKAEEDRLQAEFYKRQMDDLYFDPDSGVRNAIDYDQFMGKIERVAVNVPTQGLAGDLMRIALNSLRRWATKAEPLVQSVLRVHTSVHDEVDYSIKNRYMPFVVPRVTRKMKLRRLHKSRNWPVPIECDTEFGDSWDVKFHLTGDDSHKPSGYTDVPGLEEYLPEGFTLEIVDKLVRAISSGDAVRREKAQAWVDRTLHARAVPAARHAFWLDDKRTEPITDLATIRKQLIAAIQLHEYWTIDETPDDQESTLETFLEFEQRCGLTEQDRGYMPPGGWLFSVPLDRARRKPVPVLGALTVVEQLESPGIVTTVNVVAMEPAKTREPEPVSMQFDFPEPVAETPAPEDEMFYEPPKKVVREVPVEIRTLATPADMSAFKTAIGYKQGTHTLRCILNGVEHPLENCREATIPAEWLKETTKML